MSRHDDFTSTTEGAASHASADAPEYDNRPHRSDLAGEGFTYPIRLTGTVWTVAPDPWQRPGALSDFVSGAARLTRNGA